MPVKVSTNELSAFFDTLNRLTDTDKIAQNVADRGAEIAQRNYGRRHVTVSVEKVSDADYKVVAEGKRVAFEEYGTGAYARGSYEAETEGEGKLPTMPIHFRDGKGEMHTTQGWEYYYPSDAKALVNGRYGWYITGTVFSTGEKAKAHLWKAGKQLRDELRKKNLTDILGGKSNV